MPRSYEPTKWMTRDDLQQRKKTLMTIPLANTDYPVVGTVGRFFTEETEVWLLNAEWDAGPEVLSKLIAVLLVDAAETILPPLHLPPRPSTAHLLKNGQIRTTRGFLLAPWVLAEIGRVAEVLLSRHSDYLTQVSIALRQEESDMFILPADGFVFARYDIPSVRVGPPPPLVEIDVASSERFLHGLTREQVTAQDYCRNRYLCLLSDAQLARRPEDIIANLHVLDQRGLVSLDANDQMMPQWISLLVEVQVEMTLRHGTFPAGWDQRIIRLPNLPKSLASSGADGAVHLRPSRPARGPILVKYGKREHLEPALKKGEFRLSPASKYLDPTLNVSISDDELASEIWFDPSVPFNEAPPGTIVFPTGRKKVRAELNTNYYVFCLAEKLSTRLMFDFEYDASLVIHDPDAFIMRMLQAGEVVFRGWQSVVDRVEYFDPLQVNPAEIQVLKWKHFRYAYEEELRIAWVPPVPKQQLEYVTVTLGSIEDIAEIVLPAAPDVPASDGE